MKRKGEIIILFVFVALCLGAYKCYKSELYSSEYVKSSNKTYYKADINSFNASKKELYIDSELYVNNCIDHIESFQNNNSFKAYFFLLIFVLSLFIIIILLEINILRKFLNYY